MQFGDDAAGLQAVDQDVVAPYHVAGCFALHRLDEDSVAVEFH